MDGLLAILGRATGELSSMVFDPSERTYWGFLASSALIALMVSAWRHRTLSRRAPGEALPRRGGRLWTHSSALLDYKLVAANTLIRSAFVGVWSLSALGVAVGTVGRLDAVFGTDRVEMLSSFEVALVYTLVLFVAWDLSRYLLHRIMHSVPALWELHKVHHSAEVLTPLTLYRQHPIEGALYALRGILVTGLVTGLFFHLFRRDAVELELLGVNLLGFVFNLVGANLRHSHVWWSWGPRLERWLISPAQHQVHHSALYVENSKNLGTWLAVWDRLAGTLRTAGTRPPLRFGLSSDEANHHPHRLASALLGPLFAGARRVRSRPALAPGRSEN